MRVLITTDVVGGVWTYTAELSDALLARGHEVALMAFGGEPNPVQRRWVEARHGVRFQAVDSPLEWMPEPESGLRESLDPLRAAVARLSPGVIHLNQFYYGAFELGAPKVVVAHSDVVSWWRAVKGADPPRDEWFHRYRRWVGDGLAGASVRAAPSSWLASELRGIYRPGPVRVVHNARSPAPFDVSRTNGRRGRRVVAAGRLWDEAKGVRDLIPAAAALPDGVEVVVAGPVRHPGRGDDFPAEAPELLWAGVLDGAELRDLFASASVYAATSHYEPFGLAPVEAALAGCALVAADIPTFRELWDGCARFYPPGDGDSLAAALRELLDDEGARARLAEAARALARERYAPERMARDYERLYRDASAA